MAPSVDCCDDEVDYLLANFQQLRDYGYIERDCREPLPFGALPPMQLQPAAAEKRIGKRKRPEAKAPEVVRCGHCGSTSIVSNWTDAEETCSSCGLVLEEFFPEAPPMADCCNQSNYLRKYHVSERLKQYCLDDTDVPDSVVESVRGRMRGKEWTKDNIRQVLRALKLQKYIEKYLQIKARCTGDRPPTMSAEIMDRVQEMFLQVELPFAMFKPASRTNMLNYNYVFSQLFILLDMPQYLPYFPLLKSKQKLAELDAIWAKICEYNDWDFWPTALPDP